MVGEVRTCRAAAVFAAAAVPRCAVLRSIAAAKHHCCSHGRYCFVAAAAANAAAVAKMQL